MSKTVTSIAEKYALYSFSTQNLGDDIQALAARRYLPRVDYYIDRDHVGEWQNKNQNEQVKLITNSWYMSTPYKWPIVDSTIDPLYISMYIEQTSIETVERFLSEESRKNFKKFGTIGARDKSTYEFLKKHNIEAYVSGCVTLTLQRDERIKKGDFILLTDVSREVYEYVRRSTKRKVIYLTKATVTPLQTVEQRHELAEIYLYLYQSAHCVITERLHTALPCLALETPVLLVKKDVPIGGNKNRFAGLDELLYHYTEKEFLGGEVYDINNPPVNPEDYRTYRKAIIETCSEFTGFNNSKTFAWTDIPKTPLDDVLSRLEFTEAEHLKILTNEYIRAAQDRSELNTALQHANEAIERGNVEIQRLMGVKASARRLAGNVKRRIANSTRT